VSHDAFQFAVVGVAFFCGSLGSAVLARGGIVHTSIVAQFNFVALAFAYSTQVSLVLGIFGGWAVSIVLVLVSYLVSIYNRRTYIIVLYIGSLIAIPITELVLALLKSPDANGLSTPHTSWPLNQFTSLFVGGGFCLFLALLAFSVTRTWQSQLLAHWNQTTPPVARDLQIAGVFNTARLLRAAIPTIIVASTCFLVAVVFGRFVEEKFLDSGGFGRQPFWMLLFGLLIRDDFRFLPLTVGVYLSCDWLVANFLGTSSSYGIPAQAAFILYGVIFLALSAVPAMRQRPDD